MCLFFLAAFWMCCTVGSGWRNMWRPVLLKFKMKIYPSAFSPYEDLSYLTDRSNKGKKSIQPWWLPPINTWARNKQKVTWRGQEIWCVQGPSGMVNSYFLMTSSIYCGLLNEVKSYLLKTEKTFNLEYVLSFLSYFNIICSVCTSSNTVES